MPLIAPPIELPAHTILAQKPSDTGPIYGIDLEESVISAFIKSRNVNGLREPVLAHPFDL